MNAGWSALVVFMGVGLVAAGALYTFHPGLAVEQPSVPWKETTPSEDGTEDVGTTEGAGTAEGEGTEAVGNGTVTEGEATAPETNATSPSVRLGPPWWGPPMLAGGLGILAAGAAYALLRFAARMGRNEGT